MVSQSQWDAYARDGYLHLGCVLSGEQVSFLKERADDLALGRVVNPHIQTHWDPARNPEKGALAYRKIQHIETDDLYGQLVRHPLFLEVCAWHYGRHAPVSLYRAMVMNKPARQGTVLPWHQDGGDVWALDRDPLVTIWVAIDPATRANGCLQVVPGTHRLGLLSAHGSTLSDADANRHCPSSAIMHLEVAPGCAILLHNWLIHRSGVNPSPIPRRAFSACYTDGRTRSTLTGDLFPLVTGRPPAEHAFTRQLRFDCAALRENAARSEEYALSLRDENIALHASRASAEQYARTLEMQLRKS